MTDIAQLHTAILLIRDDLPALLGSEDWPAFAARLDALLVDLNAAADDAARAAVAAHLELLFFDVPAADARLHETLAWLRSDITSHGEEILLSGGGVMLGDIELPAMDEGWLTPREAASIPPAAMAQPEMAEIAELAPEPAAEAVPLQTARTTVRYTDIACPRRVWVQAERFTAVVRLTREKRLGAQDVHALELVEDQPVMVHADAPLFDLLTPNDVALTLTPDRDSEVSFDFRPRGELGPGVIDFSFAQNGNPAGTVKITVEVTALQVSAGAEPRLEQLVRFDATATAPDLVLHIALAAAGTERHLAFTLFRAGEQGGQPLGRTPFRSDPQRYADDLFQTMSEVARAGGGQEMQQYLQSMGWALWENLIPADLKQLYAAEGAGWADKSLLLLTDEPYIPWELLWPWDIRSQTGDDAPWGGRLRMVRWLRSDGLTRGYDGPPATLSPGHLACVAPTDTNLPTAADEHAFLQELTRAHNLEDLSPDPPDYAHMLALLNGGAYSWLHVASHGQFDADNPDAAATITLAGGAHLAPEQLTGPVIQGHIYRARPAFFFNTCHSGRQSWSLSRLGGWANKLIASGAGLFAAPMWPVADQAAYRFATTFYTQLFAGATVAEATRQGRQAAYVEGDPSWLAYSVYGHPHAMLTPGS